MNRGNPTIYQPSLSLTNDGVHFTDIVRQQCILPFLGFCTIGEHVGIEFLYFCCCDSAIHITKIKSVYAVEGLVVMLYTICI